MPNTFSKNFASIEKEAAVAGMARSIKRIKSLLELRSIRQVTITRALTGNPSALVRGFSKIIGSLESKT